MQNKGSNITDPCRIRMICGRSKNSQDNRRQLTELRENPDHVVTAQAVEAARWMAGMHTAAGLTPHTVWEQYYWVCQAGQPYNWVVDIEPYIERKIAALSVNKSQGPARANGSRLRDQLATQGKKLLGLDGDDEAADRAYIRLFGLTDFITGGEKYELACAELFLHLPPEETFIGAADSGDVERYIAEHAMPLK